MRTWLKDLRKQKRMTQKDLAQSVGVTESYICNIENGKRGCSVDFLIRVGNATHKKPEVLMRKEIEYLKEAT